MIPCSQDLLRIERRLHEDLGGRGLSRCPPGHKQSLCARSEGQFELALKALLSRPGPVGLVTGFLIPGAEVKAESDGPPGALFLARCLKSLGREPWLLSDGANTALLRPACQRFDIPLFEAPIADASWLKDFKEQQVKTLSVLIAIERAGLSHDLESFRGQVEEPADEARFLAGTEPSNWSQGFSMRGLPLAPLQASLAPLFEDLPETVFSIGIGDGGNEIGMGRFPWSLIADSLGDVGGQIACRTACDASVVAGVSNWAAYALGFGLLKSQRDPAFEYCESEEREIFQGMLRAGMIDGVTGSSAMSVDGLPWSVHAELLQSLWTQWPQALD